jgi:hypothetical protein
MECIDSLYSPSSQEERSLYDWKAKHWMDVAAGSILKEGTVFVCARANVSLLEHSFFTPISSLSLDHSTRHTQFALGGLFVRLSWLLSSRQRNSVIAPSCLLL